MENKTLEQRSYVVVKKDSKKEEPFGIEIDSLVIYRPRNISVELEVESYSAMRYHGQ